MIIPIKQIILEFYGPMTASSQHRDLVPKPNLNKGIPPENNASLVVAKSNATGIKPPLNPKFSQALIMQRDNNALATKQQLKDQAKQSSQSNQLN